MARFIKPHAIRDLTQPQVAQDIDDNFDSIWEAVKELKALIGTGSSSTPGVIGADGLPGIGMPGDDGEDGPIGPPGPRGLTGAAGAAGTPGAAGPLTIGPMGIDGDDGEDGWTIPGPPGPKGDAGAAGATGAAGPMTLGPMSLEGEPGEDGWPGPPGPSGDIKQTWEGRIVACAGDGNPNTALTLMSNAVASPTPNNIGTTIGRVSYFKLKRGITVANIRWYSIGSTTSIYHTAIYRASDNARMSSDNSLTTTAAQWDSVADAFTLSPNVLYYCVVSADTTGTTGGPLALSGTIGATTGAIQVVPTSWPGSLDINATTPIIIPYAFANVAVTAGALPDPGNTPTAITTWSGGMPAIFLDSQ